jgi:branched-subunit amino acid transport protein
MIWFAIILACVVAIVVGVYTRDLKKTLRVGILSFSVGSWGGNCCLNFLPGQNSES